MGLVAENRAGVVEGMYCPLSFIFSGSSFCLVLYLCLFAFIL